MSHSGKHALVAFGANLFLGDQPPKQTILAAVSELEAGDWAKIRLSPLYRTPCFPPGAGPDYVNACASITLRHAAQPAEVLAVLHDIEARFGRARNLRWGMRTLDIDLLAMDDSVRPDADVQDRWRNLVPAQQAVDTPDQLILPHPRLQDRAFVLVPLADVAPDWQHPRLGVSVSTLLARLPAADVAAVTRLE